MSILDKGRTKGQEAFRAYCGLKFRSEESYYGYPDPSDPVDLRSRGWGCRIGTSNSPVGQRIYPVQEMWYERDTRQGYRGLRESG